LLNKPIELVYVSGCKTPGELINGPGQEFKYIPPVWRMNSFSNTTSAKIRLGGWITSTWDGVSYGSDGMGNCSAELSGCGIEESTWQPLTKHKKSFGIRQAHEYNTLPGGGQTEGACSIWAK